MAILENKKRMEALREGKILMLPQVFYGQGWKLKNNNIFRHIIGSTDQIEDDAEILEYLEKDDENVIIVSLDEFINETVVAFVEYFAEDDEIEYEGPALSDKKCNRCGCVVLHETAKEMDYPYYCINCDQNMYSFEVHDG
jgi:hypothetical protein